MKNPDALLVNNAKEILGEEQVTDIAMKIEEELEKKKAVEFEKHRQKFYSTYLKIKVEAERYKKLKEKGIRAKDHTHRYRKELKRMIDKHGIGVRYFGEISISKVAPTKALPVDDGIEEMEVVVSA